MKRPAPLPRRNEARRAVLRARAFGPQSELCRQLPCCACKAPPPSDPDHARTRGAGGLDADCVPLCSRCHRLRHDQGQLYLVARYWLPTLSHYFDVAKEGGPSGYFEHVAAGLAAVISLARGKNGE